MSRAAFALFGLCAAVLGGTIALQLRGIEGDAVTSAVSAAAVARWRPAPEVPTPPSPDRSGEWAATALARPLFAADRRPMPETRGPAVAATAATGELPRLSGVLVTPARRVAIFAATEGTKPLVLQVGDRVGAFEVKAILAGEVTLAGAEGERVLRPSFDSRGGGATRQAPSVAAASGGGPMPLPPGSQAGAPAR